MGEGDKSPNIITIAIICTDLISFEIHKLDTIYKIHTIHLFHFKYELIILTIIKLIINNIH